MTLVVTHPYVSSGIAESTASGVAGGLVGPNEWNANHTLAGIVSPAQGGTGITSGTGVTYFSSATVIADSGTLTANALVVGGGANVAPATLSSLGTTSTLLHGNASGNPSFGAVNLGSEVAGTLSTGNLTAATTALFGIIKPDNSTISISSGVISTVGGGISGSGAANQVTFWSSAAIITGDGSFTYTGAGTGVTVKLSSSTSTAGISALSIVTSSSSNMASNATALNITATFNNSGTVYDAPLFLNAVNTASGTGSALVDLQIGGSSKFQFVASCARTNSPAILLNGVSGGSQVVNLVANTGTLQIGREDANLAVAIGWNGNSWSAGAVTVEIGGGYGWSSVVGGSNLNAAPETSISRRAAGIVSIQQAQSLTSANSFQVYNTVDVISGAPTNYERAVLDFTTTTNVLTIGAQASGTGTIRPVLLVAGANSGTSAVVSLNLATAKVAQFGDGGANANGWMQWAGESRVSANSTTTSTSLANIPGLAFKPQASRNYSFQAHLIFTDAAAGGIQCTVNATSTTTTYTLTFDGWVTDTVAVRGYAQGSAFGNVVASSLTTSTVGHVMITGTLMTSATAPSTVTIQFAQNTSNATPTTILVGSYMWAHDMP